MVDHPYSIYRDKQFTAWREELEHYFLKGEHGTYTEFLIHLHLLAPDESPVEVMYDYGYEEKLSPAEFVKNLLDEIGVLPIDI